ncbi:NADPH quinone oxidoreductase [Mucilaginibacter sp. MD40]|uniref:NAD(P)H-dependent oxidoreductase n=1 Tax=Mucilaginibacter sp. MD40 TaxID=2029590 RepID=UPI000BAC4F0C|nr:NAD(P)H-dependent oxidoreductase [Mucilaginibacter sp. MD40]PAW92017.1 NADPH quinone oxidoreductase [Mucilaginibacter sp. MD40]
MKILIVYAHPERKSFNGAMFQEACRVLEAEGHQVQTSDLYGMAFKPVSDASNFTGLQNPDYFKQQLEELHATANHLFSSELKPEIKKIEWCELMIWQFPLWWFSVPAILKGWVDRTFAMGQAYGSGRIYETGFFKDKKALLSLTTGGPQDAYLKDGLQGDINGILRPLQRGILQFTGFKVLTPHVVYGPARMSGEEREYELKRWGDRLRIVADEPEFNVGRY